MLNPFSFFKKDDKVANLTNDNFEKSIASGISLVDFWAPWCQPCRIQGPVIDEIAKETKDSFQVFKVDIEKNQGLAKKYSIKSIPALIIFKNGKPAKRFTGLKPKNVLINALQNVQQYK